RHACTSRAQLGRQSRTDVGRWKLATHDYRSELSGSGDHSGLNDGAANAAPAKSRSDFERAVAPGLSIIGNPELISRRTSGLPVIRSRLQIMSRAAKICSMESLYQCDLAYVQAVAFETLARGAAPEIIRRLQTSSTRVRKVMDVGCGAGPLTKALVEVG